MFAKSNSLNPFKKLNKDISSSIVVFLVVLPLCLGIVKASGAILFSRLISDIIGGIVIDSFSGPLLGILVAILIIVGFKLAKPALFKFMYNQDWGQFIPFLIPILGIIFFEPLKGISFGMAIAIFIVLKNNYKIPLNLNSESKDDETSTMKITWSEDVTFLNKTPVLSTPNNRPDNSIVEINASEPHFIHYDVTKIIEDFAINAELRGIELTIVDLYNSKDTNPLDHLKKTKK